MLDISIPHRRAFVKTDEYTIMDAVTVCSTPCRGVCTAFREVWKGKVDIIK